MGGRGRLFTWRDSGDVQVVAPRGSISLAGQTPQTVIPLTPASELAALTERFSFALIGGILPRRDRRRSPEQVTLAIAAAHRQQRVALCRGLDAFCNGLDAERARQRQDRHNHRIAVAVGDAQARDEAAI